MNEVVIQALTRWGMTGADYTLAAERENRVFEVTHNGRKYALRLHRQGYRSDAELLSELDWMAALSSGGLSIPKPVFTSAGTHLVQVDGIQVDVLTWLNGVPLSECLDHLQANERERVFHELGSQLAKLHSVSDAWTPPPSFGRASWDTEGLVGDSPLWDRFWENPKLTAKDRDLFLQFRKFALDSLNDEANQLDYGLIHADLVPGNVLYDNGALHLIDFDDGGWGYRLFDLATTLLKHRDAPDYASLKSALLNGYKTQRPIDDNGLDLMLCLRALTYVGWNITRMSETGGAERNVRFIKTASDLCQTTLSASTITY